MFPRRRVRRIVGALSCVAYRDRRDACEATWVPLVENDDTVVVFLIGDPRLAVDSVLDGRTLRLRCGDEYQDLPEKTRRFAAWAVQSYDFDHLFKCDDDTYINADAFHSFDPGGADYLGHPVEPFYASGGAGYFLSAEAAAIVAEGPLDHWAEDKAVGQLLMDCGLDLDVSRRFVNCNPDWNGTIDPDAVTHHLQRLLPQTMRDVHAQVLATEPQH